MLVGTNSTTYYDYSAAVGTTYYYWVKACNSYGCSAYSGYDTGWRSSSGTTPPPPASVSASNGTYTDKVRVTWSSSPGATFYRVYRATSSGIPMTLLASPTGTTYDDHSAAVCTTYYYQVRACNSYGTGSGSSLDTGWRGCPAPSAPTGVSASDGTYTDKVRVTWNSSSGATYYRVYRATSSTGTRTLLTSPTGTTYDHWSAAVDTTYYYWVKACNSYGCSGYSNYNTGWRISDPSLYDELFFVPLLLKQH